MVKKTFERLNKGGKRLRPVEIRAARYNETSLHKRVVNQIEKIVNQTHPRYQYAKQMFEFYLSKSASRSQESGEKRLTNEEIKLYDVITRRLAYSLIQLKILQLVTNVLKLTSKRQKIMMAR